MEETMVRDIISVAFKHIDKRVKINTPNKMMLVLKMLKNYERILSSLKNFEHMEVILRKIQKNYKQKQQLVNLLFATAIKKAMKNLKKAEKIVNNLFARIKKNNTYRKPKKMECNAINGSIEEIHKSCTEAYKQKMKMLGDYFENIMDFIVQITIENQALGKSP